MFNKLNFNLRTTDTVQRLLYLNIAVFLVVRITFGITSLFNTPLLGFDDVSEWIALPSNTTKLLLRPWTIITYMFYQWEVLHLLFNMIWLYFMGSIIQEFLGQRKLFGIYLMGGLAGALAYVVALNSFPVFAASVNYSFALGASASVLAITIAAATLLPDRPIQVFFVTIPLKWLAIVTVVLDLINIAGNNAGGHLAHLGGAIFGFIYIKSLQKGVNLTSWLEKIAGIFSGRKSNLTVAYKRGKSDEEFVVQKKARQEQMDEILDKINKSGYGSLSQNEKDFLFKISKEDQK